MKIKLCSLVLVQTKILMRMRRSDTKMESGSRKAAADRANLIMMFRHATTDRADLIGQLQQRKLVRPRFKEGWVSESGSDFSLKSRLNPGLSGNVAECKIGGSVSDELAPHGQRG